MSGTARKREENLAANLKVEFFFFHSYSSERPEIAPVLRGLTIWDIGLIARPAHILSLAKQSRSFYLINDYSQCSKF